MKKVKLIVGFMWLLILCGFSGPPPVNAQFYAAANPPEREKVYAQTESTKILKNVLNELEIKYHVSFIYKDENIKIKIRTEKKNFSNLEEELEYFLKPNDLTFEKVRDNFYAILSKKDKAEEINKIESKENPTWNNFANSSASPNDLSLLTRANGSIIFNNTADFVVRGKVTAENNEGIPGANIIYKGTTLGTTSDKNGNYSLMIPDGNGTLVISYIGYVAQEIAINNRSIIDVRLEVNIKSLQEVIVVGYGSQKKSDVTGAISSVSSKQIQEVPVQNLSQALQGRAAGVDIAASNFRPGEVPTIRIRGNRSVNAGNDPLYVVDGIPMSQGKDKDDSYTRTSINDFNPQDIESIQILKDASATAIYGSRGANGVILITTKRGKEGKFSINYDGYYSFDKALVSSDTYNGPEYAELRREAQRVAGKYPTLYPNPKNDFEQFGKDYYMWESIAKGYQWKDKDNRIPEMRPTTEEEKALYGVDEIPIYNPGNVRTFDWEKQALRNAVSKSHQISAQGGTEKLRALFSAGYLKQEGIQLGQDFSRYNVRLSLDFKVNNFINVGGAINSSYSIQNYGPDMYGKITGQLPSAMPYDSLGNYILNPGGDDLIVNPIRDPNLVFNEKRNTRFFGSFYAEVQLLKGLRYRINFGPDLRNYRGGEFQSALSSNRLGSSSQGSISWAKNDQIQNFTYVVENLLYYDKKFGNDHSLGITLLQSIQEDRRENMFITANDLPYESQKWFNLKSTYKSTPEDFGSGFNKVRLSSYMGRINYSFKEKYLLTASVRSDGSSVLAPSHQWDLFPSFALAWKAHNESFLKNISFLNELKFRAGYGEVGQTSVPAYLTGGNLLQTNYVWDETPAYGFTPNPGLLPNNIGGLPKPDLGWEKTSTLNGGVDFGFIQGRIMGSVDVYQATTTDLLLTRSIPTASGFNNILQNIGSTKNTGLEISLSTVNIKTPKGFQWNTDVVFTKNKEEFVSLSSGPQDDLANRWFIGKPLRSFYDYKFEGIWQNTPEDLEKMELYNAKSPGLKLTPGKIKIADLNNDTIFNANDQTILGSNVPKWTGSITNRFSYKGIELSFMVYTRVGQTINNISYRGGLTGRYQGMKQNYWTPTNPSNEFPRPDPSADIQLFGSSLQYQDGTFVKVRNISLSYTFPKSIVSKFKGTNLSVYVNAVNPFLFTKFRALDPEVTEPGTGSADNVQAKGLSTKSLVVGVRIGI